MNLGDTDAEVLAFDQTYGIEYPSISGVEGGGTAVNTTYGINAYPTYILIAPNGQIVEQDMWPISSAQTFKDYLTPYGITPNPCGVNTAAELITFSIPEQSDAATIGAGVIDVNLTANTPLTALIPQFSISSGAWATIGGVTQESGVTPVDFTTGTVTYTIHAEDAVTTQDWAVTVHGGLDIELISLSENSIYPNPANNFINVSEATKLTFVNSLGQIIKVVDSPKGQIDVSGLATGTYTISINNERQVTYQTLIIKR